MTRKYRIEVSDETESILRRRCQYEELNPSTLFNRAMKAYDDVMQAMESGGAVYIKRGDQLYELQILE